GLFSSNTQKSTTKVNARASRESERLNRQIQRMSSQYLGKVSVIATHWHQDKKYAESQAKRVISVLMSGITPADKEEDMKIKIKKGQKDFEKALAGKQVGNHTILTPEEATTYFTLPQCNLGLKVSRREEFATGSADITEMQGPQLTPKETPMQKLIREHQERRVGTSSPSLPEKQREGLWRFPIEELIFLGYTLRNGEPQKMQPQGLVRRILASHVGIYGNTGSGKTTISVSLVAQAYRNHVILTIITPGNVGDWRVLKDLFPELRIFTAGNPDIAPLRYNMWDVPPGVPVGKYIDRLTDVHTAALPNDGVISMHFDDIFNTMYENCGWGRMGNVRGRSIVLADLYQAFQQVAMNHISYGEEMSRDFYGALDARLRSMFRNEILVDMLNTPKGFSIPELLAHPTIIETRDLSPEDRALLTGALTAGISEYLIANPKKQVSHLLVLEEAHHLLKRTSGPSGYAEPTSKQKAIDNIVEMLRIQRGNGLGLLLIDQLPGSMVPDAVKLPGNVIIHTLTDLEERLLVGRQALCTDAQIKHIGGMGIGEAVIRIQTRNVPANIQVLPLAELVNIPLPGRDWNDPQVKDSMAEVFEAHPELRESHPLSDEMKDLLKGIRQPAPPQTPVQHELPLQVAHLSSIPETDISEIVSSPMFTEEYLNRIKSAKKGNPLPVATMLTVVAGKFCSHESERIPFTERLLLHAAGVLQEPKETSILSEILVAIGSEST
ncbi:MAG: ATP-binding protein, partial [Candidatus Thorarchaeota archaeon]